MRHPPDLSSSFLKSLFILNLITILFVPGWIFSRARHSIAPVISHTIIQTTNDDQVQLTSPAINYTGDIRIWDYRLYFSVSALFPRWANQNGRKCHLSDVYTSAWGTDLFIGISKDYEIVDRFCIVPAVGWHQNGIRLRAKSEYMDFYSLTSGFSLHLFTKYRGKHPILNFMFLAMAMDFMDLLYVENKLKRGYTINFGLGHTF